MKKALEFYEDADKRFEAGMKMLLSPKKPLQDTEKLPKADSEPLR